ncbi:MAG TPA: phosphoribosyltransferase family protein [Frankiaceae bacterium]|jgi:hypoxanthine phosphoribosyltransferase|nr:phosphoribosyltransferase family protein [Frankiaceae bacterium]
MPDVSDAPVWETWDSVFLKTTTLGHQIIRETLAEPGGMISRIAVVPRGGLYMVNVLSRMLGLSGSEVLSLSISKYDREHPTQAGEFRVGSVPAREAVAGQVVLLADEVHDTGETMQSAKRMLLDLGASAVLTAAIHYKPGPNTTGIAPDFFVVETNGWVHYPWETIDPAGTLYRHLLDNRDQLGGAENR